MATTRLVVAIDARPLSRPHSGIRRYLENVLVYLLKNPDLACLLYTDRPIESDIDLGNAGHCRIAKSRLKGRLFWSSCVRRWINDDQPDIYWTPRHQLPGGLPPKLRTVVTIHDMVWRSHPKTMRLQGWLSEVLTTPYSIKNADSIISVSQGTADEIARYYPGAQDKTVVIRHGDNELPQPLEPKRDVNSLNPYFLSVGTVEPRKNYPRLIEAFSVYANRGGSNNLVFVGPKGWGWGAFEKSWQSSAFRDRIFYFEDVTDTELAWFYANAQSHVMVTLAEGYGFPVLEAARYGLPMVLSDLTVLREQQPENVIWVNPRDIYGIATALEAGEALVSNDSGKVDLRPWQQVSLEIKSLLAE